MIEQPGLDDDDDYKRVHTDDLSVYPEAIVLGEYRLVDAAQPDALTVEALEGMRVIQPHENQTQCRTTRVFNDGYNSAIDAVIRKMKGDV